MADKRLILLGSGHAHLLLTKRLDVLREAGIDPLLIASRWFDYSGLATGVLSGALPPAANRIDVAGLASRRGLAFVEGFAVAIDRAAQTVTLADGSQHGFDFLSLNIGSVVGPDVAGNDVRPVKPLAGLTALRVQIESRAQFPHVLIVGAGRAAPRSPQRFWGWPNGPVSPRRISLLWGGGRAPGMPGAHSMRASNAAASS